MFNSNSLYTDDLKTVSSLNFDFAYLTNKSILITGSTGLIGTFLVDLLMFRNNFYNNNITIYALGRSKNKASVRFNEYFNSKFFKFIETDILKPFEINESIDFIIHGASNTHPVAYATEPINTILLSVQGTKSVLDLAISHNVKRTIFLSSVEIYGENRGDVEYFSENYCGYIDCNTVRAGYTEGKRVAESLCQAYIKEKNIDIVIARCSRVFGPTMNNDDSKAIAQFIKCAVNNENIILKSKGEQQYSYCYVGDICSALLYILLNGNNGETYNIANMNFNLSLMQIANILAKFINKEVIFSIPSHIESAGYSKATKALLDCQKLSLLKWKPLFSIPEALIRTVNIMRNG